MTEFSNINRLSEEDNLGGGHYFLFIPPEDIVADADVIDNNIITEIELESGKSWYKAEFSQITLQFTEGEKLSKGNHITTPTLNGYIAKDNIQSLNQLFSMAKKGLVVLYYNNNGEARMIGSKENPAMLTRKTNHGNATQKNAIAFSISSTNGQGGAPFYLSTVPAVNVCVDSGTAIQGFFESGYADLPDFTVGSDAAGTYIYLVTDGTSDPLTFKINNVTTSLPFTLEVSDVLTVTRQNSSIDGFFKISK